jgi:hypothetical protein
VSLLLLLNGGVKEENYLQSESIPGETAAIKKRQFSGFWDYSKKEQ